VIYISQHRYKNFKIEQVESLTDEDMAAVSVGDYTIVDSYYEKTQREPPSPPANTRAILFSLAQGW
jgi:hypothetical protein